MIKCRADRVLPDSWETPVISSQMCPRCQKILPSNEFHKNRRRGLQVYCKTCQTEHSATYKEAHSKNSRRSHLNRKYGMTPGEYEQMLQAQGGVCDLCKQPETMYDPKTGKVRPLAVDHDHVTGAVRALLCKSCNQALGMAKENPEVLRRMADYIEEHKNRQM